MNALSSPFLPLALLLDVPEIDDQHAGLFWRLASLKSHCIEQNALPHGEVDALLHALREHCATEEEMAVEAGLDFAAHAEKHAKMLQQIEKMLLQVSEEKADVFSLIKFLEYWFERHIQEEDKHLGRCLQQAPYPNFRPVFAWTPIQAMG